MPLSVPGLPGLPPDLAGPVAVQLAKPVRSIPPEGALPGGCVYEPKWDGYRLVVVRDGASTRLWSKQGRDLTALFPEIVAAAVAQVPPGTVLDGEVVIWNGSRLDFGLLQLRMATPAGRMGTLAAANPASYVAFDLLAAGAADLRGRHLAGRRSALEDLAGRWAPPLQLSPATSDRTEAQRWFDDFRPPAWRAWSPRARPPATRRADGSGSRSSPGRPRRCSPVGSSARWSGPANWSPAATGTASWSWSAVPARSRPRRRPSWPTSSVPPRRPTPGRNASAPGASAGASCPCRSPASTRRWSWR